MSHAPDNRHVVSRRLVLGALLAAALLVVATMIASSLHGIRRVETVTVEYREEVDRLERLAEGTRTVQVEFKTQVQEWKNILLRGHDPAQFERFLGAFMARNAEIQLRLEELLVLARDASFPETALADLKVRHRELQTAYQGALEGFRGDDPLSPRRVDALLQGRDRLLNAQFDRLAATIDGFEDASSAAFAERLDRIATDLRATIWTHASVLVVLALLGTLVVGRSRTVA